MNKTVIGKVDLEAKPVAPGLSGVGIFAKDYPIEPYLMFSEFRMSLPVFGPHPHAGISVMTYMRPDSQDSFINRDDLSGLSFIEPGGLHIMQAGAGMHHDEFPKTEGVETRGFQIWFNHAEKDRLVTPQSIHVDPDDVPEVEDDHARVRIVHGTYAGKSTPYQMVTDADLLHVYLKPNKIFRIAAREMAFVYGLEGSASTGGTNIAPQTLVNFSAEGKNVVITAGKTGLQFMFGGGTPINEPILYGGPFVATTSEQMAEIRQRYERGEMGVLEPYKQTGETSADTSEF
ncbi:pirin-like C-terminal cupin domain-containing protein [Phyllobacterium sp. SB3]|uniref:pirin family protein n=1 Tax=Phyllobacterium sp. SB3 TaxID=3156073 RepID=UPI0032AF69D1